MRHLNPSRLTASLEKCNTEPYLKSDGSFVCGIVLAQPMAIEDASFQCQKYGGRLAEPRTLEDNKMLLMLTQVPYFIKHGAYTSITSTLF